MEITRYAAAAALACLVSGASAYNLTVDFETPTYGDGEVLTGTNGWLSVDGSSTPERSRDRS